MSCHWMTSQAKTATVANRMADRDYVNYAPLRQRCTKERLFERDPA